MTADATSLVSLDEERFNFVARLIRLYKSRVRSADYTSRRGVRRVRYCYRPESAFSFLEFFFEPAPLDGAGKADPAILSLASSRLEVSGELELSFRFIVIELPI